MVRHAHVIFRGRAKGGFGHLLPPDLWWFDGAAKGDFGSRRLAPPQGESEAPLTYEASELCA
jgi:hypothetical protein